MGIGDGGKIMLLFLATFAIMVLNAARYLRTDIVIMGVIVMGVVGYGFDLLMRLLERRVIPWKGNP